MSRLENDCLAILAYAAAHRGEKQTFRSLSEATNIPRNTIHRILTWHIKNGKNNSVLFMVAAKYRYDVKVFQDRDGLIIDAVKQDWEAFLDRGGED